MRLLSGLVCALLASASPAAAAEIINGDFSTGDFSGWTVQAFANLFDNQLIDPAPFAGVENGPAGPYAGMRTLNFDVGADGSNQNDLGLLQISQNFIFDPAKPVLGVDVGLLGASNDPTGAGNATFSDAFFIEIFDLSLYRHREGGIEPDFGGVGAFRNISVTLGTPIDPLFQTRVFFDLGDYLGDPFFAGQAIPLEFLLLPQNDSRALTFGFDNVAFQSSSSSVVPEPASWALMIVGFGMVGAALRHGSGLMGRRRKGALA